METINHILDIQFNFVGALIVAIITIWVTNIKLYHRFYGGFLHKSAFAHDTTDNGIKTRTIDRKYYFLGFQYYYSSEEFPIYETNSSQIPSDKSVPS